MAKATPSATQLIVPASARFSRLPKRLTAIFVKDLFKDLLTDNHAKAVGKAEIRKETVFGNDKVMYSFLCFKTQPVVGFLQGTKLKELRFGFALLIEFKKHVAVFQRGATGLDARLMEQAEPIPRQELMHAWGNVARYRKFGTKRMSVAQQELRGASYEADDLETALPSSVASRSILNSIRMQIRSEGTVAVTPGTGRVQKSGEKGGLAELVEFVDELIGQLGAKTLSPFLSAFPAPLLLSELPDTVKPTGLLFDVARLQNYIEQPETAATLQHAQDPTSTIWAHLAPVLDVEKNANDDDRWTAKDGQVSRARLKRLTDTFGIIADLAKGWYLDHGNQDIVPLDRWLRENDAFSVSFSDPEYFYTHGSLYRRAGFKADSQLVLGMLEVQPALDTATSEKGDDTDAYDLQTTAFEPLSIFHVIENVMSSPLTHLCCGDLTDEWADYFGIDGDRFTFFHAKDGKPTAGASDFQIVVAQALKNLSRVKVRPDTMETKLVELQNKTWWTAGTRIPRLAKGPGWPLLIAAAKALIGNPRANWRVALVVTALSKADFIVEMGRAKPKAHFIQLVWLLSAFSSNCKDRDATPIVYCRT
jgi:hypothetical protein